MLIQVQNLTFAYDGSHDNIFENASFSIDTAWRLGFVGRNGRGKTTFLRLLMGEYPNGGAIHTAETRFSYFPFPVKNEELLTGDLLEEIASMAEGWEIRRELSLLDMQEDALYRPYCTLSHGERTKAQLAALFLRRDTLPLIDEPTNHLDAHGRGLLSEYLSGKKGFILVSHDRRFLDGCVDHILAINKTGFETIKGNFSSWQRSRDMQDAHEIQENEKLTSEIRRLGTAAKKTAGWSDKIEAGKIGEGVADRGYVGHKSAKMMKRAKSIEKRRQAELEEKACLMKDVEYHSPLAIHPLTHYAKRLVEVRELQVQYGEAPVFSGLSFVVEQGSRVALTGKNGCGKSSVLKLISGEDIPHSGIWRLASGLHISCVPQDTSFLHGDLSAFARQADIDESLFKTILRKLGFQRVQFEKDMAEFSAGQRKKVLLAKSLAEEAHLYIWDEPLNYVDVLSRIQVEELLQQHAPTMLLVEHDAAFLDAVSTHRVEL